MSLQMAKFLLHGVDIISTLFWIGLFVLIIRGFVRKFKGVSKEEKAPKGIRKELRSVNKELKQVRIRKEVVTKDGTTYKVVGLPKTLYKKTEQQARIQVVKNYPAWKPLLFKEEYWILAANYLLSKDPDATDDEKSAKWQKLIGNYIVDREYKL